ncbi:MAG: 4Fe-4S binding protein [Burkholderiales bacterium]|nr:4Fe-4S binding protein [Burkholderiales bacterium]
MTTYHWKRRAVQVATIFLIVLIPASGLFRIDLTTASFLVLDRQVLWSNFFLVFGLALITATAPLLTYMTIGRVWCGWACPQNTVAEWATKLTHKILGKRANVDIGSDGLIVAASKNKLLNWIILALSFLGVSMLLAIIPFFYFYPADVVWSFVTLNVDPKFSRFMNTLYFVFVVAVFLDIAAIRYFWCNYICLYRIGQLIFGSKNALHVEYDTRRSEDCAKCNYCSTSCVMGIDPTRFKPTDNCISCGECIDACNRLHDKKGASGLLRYDFGEGGTLSARILAAVARINLWVVLVFLLGCAMLLWGLLK